MQFQLPQVINPLINSRGESEQSLMVYVQESLTDLYHRVEAFVAMMLIEWFPDWKKLRCLGMDNLWIDKLKKFWSIRIQLFRSEMMIIDRVFVQIGETGLVGLVSTIIENRKIANENNR